MNKLNNTGLAEKSQRAVRSGIVRKVVDKVKPEYEAKGADITLKRTDIYTYLEHRLFGSTIGKKYSTKPYTPIAIIDGLLSVEECNEHRKANSILEYVSASYFDATGMQGVARIAPLNTNPDSKTYGQYLHDPILIAKDNNKFHRKYSAKLPWRSSPKVELKMGEHS